VSLGKQGYKGAGKYPETEGAGAEQRNSPQVISRKTAEKGNEKSRGDSKTGAQKIRLDIISEKYLIHF
jgi:hypothetical protein